MWGILYYMSELSFSTSTYKNELLLIKSVRKERAMLIQWEHANFYIASIPYLKKDPSAFPNVAPPNISTTFKHPNPTSWEQQKYTISNLWPCESPDNPLYVTTQTFLTIL